MLGVVLVAAVAAAAWVGVRGFLAYGHLLEAQDAAFAVRADLTDPAAASQAVAEISAETAAARELTSDPVWGFAESLPWVGPQLGAVATVSAALDDVAGSALDPLIEVASTFDIASLTPQGGGIALAGFVALQQPAVAGAQGIAAAADDLAGIDRAPLVAPLRAAVDDVAALLDETEIATGALARTTALLPSMLGAEGARNYLVLFQNNAEWRSLGGIPGAMAIIRADGGALSMTAQDSAGDFPDYGSSVLPPDPEVESIYGQHPGRWMQNVTQVPDFATSSQLAREMWSRKHGEQVDGVVALDPVALSYLLVATGPVTLPTGDVLTSENAVSLLLNDVYKRYELPAAQDAFFAGAAGAVFNALSGGGIEPTALLTALARAGDEHRLLLWSAHAEEQERLAETTLAGGLPTSDDDVARFGVYVNDGTGSKMDYYGALSTDIAWTSCQVGGEGRATGDVQLTVTVANNAPADAASLPRYITGGGGFGVPEGTARTVTYVYLPEGWELVETVKSDGGGFGGGVHENRRVVSFTVDLAPGASAFATVTARAVEPSAASVSTVTTPTLAAQEDFAATCAGT
ncbi:DUF4012 domain-containing protein [Microbacterium hominis]|uniref:DUF4012 domain-containing protein n=1 Tax=Microbacterium hominis TaxID=162426 RepID=A0A7D4Q3W7_9MICO|nr:DUF4012 domain-containing protein [Microbacterium hominis]